MKGRTLMQKRIQRYLDGQFDEKEEVIDLDIFVLAVVLTILGIYSMK